MTEPVVERIRAAAIGVAFNDQMIPFGMLLPQIQHRLQGRPARGSHPSPVGVEEHVLGEQNAIFPDHDGRLVRAAVFVVNPVDRLWFVGTLVHHVWDSVLVVVGIRAAVLVFEAVEVLRLVGTFVHVVRDSIAVPIENFGLLLDHHDRRWRDRRRPV